MGGLLAYNLATTYKVNKLILSAPAFYLKKNKEYKLLKFLMKPPVYWFVNLLFPFLPKKICQGRLTIIDSMDNENLSSHLTYLAVPPQSAFSVIRLQDKSQTPRHLKCDHIQVLYGKHDGTINTKRFIEKYSNTIKFEHELELNNTAHHPYRDLDKNIAIAQTMKWLTST